MKNRLKSPGIAGIQRRPRTTRCIFLRTAAARVGTLNPDTRATFQILRRASVYDINAPSARCRGWRQQPPPPPRVRRFLNRPRPPRIYWHGSFMHRVWIEANFSRNTGSSSLLAPCFDVVSHADSTILFVKLATERRRSIKDRR